ncbi:MAG TPA: serine hydrolase [Candidatus Eremiobacteraceae bacterium]|nr:serine hydrolase [Candidatus Eremiobacteraceae bacterium]
MTALLTPQPDAALDIVVREALKSTDLDTIGHAVVIDLQTMRRGRYRETENIYPASVIKVALMVEAYRQIADGRLDLDTAVTVSAANQTTTAETTPLAPGYRATLRELIDLMITASDNIATNELYDLLGRETVTEAMRGLGLTTFLAGRKLSGSEPLIDDPGMTGRNRLPPDEIALLLALIALDRVPFAAEQRAILARCLHNEKLAAGLSRGDRFMHKTGETDEVSHDAGILVTSNGRRYVVVLYTSPPPLPDRSYASHYNAQLAEWMRRLREYL